MSHMFIYTRTERELMLRDQIENQKNGACTDLVSIPYESFMSIPI